MIKPIKKTLSRLPRLKNKRVNQIINTGVNILENRYRPLRVFSEPMTIQIEPTNRCNLSCKQCFRYSPNSKRDVGDMTFDNFKKIMSQFKNVFGVSLIGLGESFLNKDLPKMISCLGEKKIEPYLTTNGTIINDDLISAMNRAKTVRIQFSLDAASRSTYHKIRGRDYFDQVIDNIESFMSQKDPNVFVSLGFVVMKENLNELNKLILLAKRLGIRTIHLGDLSGSWLGDNRDKLLIDNFDSLNDIINNANRLSKQSQIDLKYNQYFYIWQNEIYKKRCWFPWQSPYITWDGFLTPCCNLPVPEKLNFGNVLEKPFSQLWNSKKYVNFRHSLKSGNHHTLCQTCHYIL